MNKSIYINTLGCAKNEVDSKNMAKKLKGVGYTIVDDYEKADLFIINTCSFIEAATSESIDATLDFLDIKNDRDVAVVVSGCMPSRYSDSLSSQLPEVDAFLPCADEENVVEVVSELIGLPDKPSSNAKDVNNRTVSAYIKISEGCDRACSFCTIPKIRGRYRSFTYDEIKTQVESAINEGAVEINFIAQDTGHWGRDFKKKDTLANLLDKVADDFKNTYFRVLYVQPDEVTDELLNVISNHDNIINYLDIPLQHVSSKILSKMNRTGSAQEFISRIENIRSSIPDVTLRTTFMVGFPGETDEDFQELLDFAALGLFDYAGVFAYSNEEEASSFSFSDQIDEEEKKYRLRELSDVVDALGASKMREKIGSSQRVLIEGAEDDGQLFGRCLFQAPEVDGVTYVDKGQLGEIVNVKIVDTLMYDLEGEVS